MSPPATVERPAPEVIAAVRASCAAVADRPVRLAESFYAHLFEMAPQLRPMFPPDLTGQMQKMSDTLLTVIAQLDTADPAELEAAIRRLGADHRTRFRVEPEHYLYVGHALARAVRNLSGTVYPGSLSSAWIAVYQWVAAQMVAGADAAESAAEAAEAAQAAPGALPRPREPREGALAPARRRHDADRADD
ncbi:MAG TPA: globin domain-containing protein [Pseudonocardia sp.]|nr:globin domain-containing protein [Pseudonocardia sp.]